MFRDSRWPEGWSPSNKYPLLDGKTELLSETRAHRHAHTYTRTPPPKHWEPEWWPFSQKAYSWINAFIPWTNSTRLWVIPVINNSKTRTIYFVCSKQPIKTSQFWNLSLDSVRFFGWYVYGINSLCIKLLTNTKPQTDLSFFGFNGKVRPETTAMVLESYQNDWNGRGQIKVMRWSIYTTQLSFDKHFVFYLNGRTIFLWCLWQPLRISVDHTRLIYSINNIDYQVIHLG